MITIQQLVRNKNNGFLNEKYSCKLIAQFDTDSIYTIFLKSESYIYI